MKSQANCWNSLFHRPPIYHALIKLFIQMCMGVITLKYMLYKILTSLTTKLSTLTTKLATLTTKQP